MKTLKAAIKLGSKVTVYVPSTVDVDKPVDNAAIIARVAETLSTLFGGATSTSAIGYWVSDSAGLVREATTMVFAYASDSALAEHIDTVVSLCARLCVEMRQDAVALEVNGEMYFIDATFAA